MIQIENAVFDFAEETNFITVGDINSDSLINIQDVIIIVNISLSIITPTDYQSVSGDINGDGVIDVLDIIILVNLIMES